MKYVIDIDGTICITKLGDYNRSTPIKDRIMFINTLYENGNNIVYFTARGMNSSKDNHSLANIKWFDFTKNQLESWGAKFHELIIGKPSADFYIDDKCLSPDIFFNSDQFRAN